MGDFELRIADFEFLLGYCTADPPKDGSARTFKAEARRTRSKESLIENHSELSALGVSAVNTPLTLSHSRKRLWRILILVLVSVALFAFHAAILQRMANYLITEDPPRKAAAIVALRGQVPFRELEAAKYYHEGFAPIVILVPNKPLEEARELVRLGVKVTQDWQYGREVLVKQGVPPAAIVIAKGEGEGTLEELRVVWGELVRGEASGVRGNPKNVERNNATNTTNAEPRASENALNPLRLTPNQAGNSEIPRVILVTSKYHTRRTRLTWHYVTGGRSQAIVRAASGDSFDANRWWQTRRHALAVVREYLGLINYYAGFPVSP